MAPELHFPFGGRSDDRAFSDQNPLTSRAETFNVQGRDPVTGRMRGAQRAGMSKVTAAALPGGKVVELCTVVGDNRKVSYAANTTGTEVFQEPSGASGANPTSAVAADRFGNVYRVTGNATLEKRNGDGMVVWTLPLPVEDPNHVVRALWVDDLQCVYAGVSAGGSQSTARQWKYTQAPPGDSVEAKFDLVWQREPGAYTEEIRVREDKLWAALNYPDRNESRIEVLEALDAAVPVVTKTVRRVPYPINSFDVGSNGLIFTTHEGRTGTEVSTPRASAYRPGHPSTQGFWPSTEVWTPRDLDDFEARVWRWHRAGKGEGVEDADLSASGLLNEWRDISGKGRHLTSLRPFSGGTLNEAPPLYSEIGINGQGAVVFGDDADGNPRWLATPSSNSLSKDVADQHNGLFPAYTDAAFAAFFVVRLVPGSTVEAIFHQPNSAAGASDHVGFFNRDCQVGALPGTATSDAFSYYATTDATDAGACAAGDQPLGVTSASGQVGDVGILSVVWDGGVTGQSVVRWNGAPVDLFEGLAIESLEPAFLGGRWTGSALADAFSGDIAEILVIDRGDRYNSSATPLTVSFDALESGGSPQTDNEVTRIEGYLAWRYGVQLNMDSGHPFGFGGFNAAYGPAPDGDSGSLGGLVGSHEKVVKWDERGRPVWCYSAKTATDLSLESSDYGGVGWGIAYDEERGSVSCRGSSVTTSGDPPFTAYANAIPPNLYRRIVDKGTSFSLLGADDAWKASGTGSQVDSTAYRYPRVAVGSSGESYFPVMEDGAPGVVLRVFVLDGSTQVASYSRSTHFGRAVALNPLSADFAPDTPGVVESVFIGVDNDPSLVKVQYVDATPAGGATRTRTNLAVTSGGEITSWSTGGIVALTGGPGAISTSSDYVQCAITQRGRAVFVDGVGAPKVFDLKANTVSTLTAEGAGSVPQNYKLAEFWRKRLVLARGADDPHAMVMSGQNSDRDWDFEPPVPLATSAVGPDRILLGRAGASPDIVNGFGVISDDLAIVGGDHTLWRLTGDPQDGGQFDQLSQSIGMAFGRAWCLDDQGRFFFWGLPSGLYTLDGAGNPVEVVRDRLRDTEFDAIDYGTHYLRLYWDPVARGIRIFQFPFGVGGTLINHWFWEKRTHELVQQPPIWTYKYGAATVQPTAFVVVDGDAADDRMVVLGCEDGHLRMESASAKDDDGTAIDSSFVATAPISETHEVALRELQVNLATAQGGLTWCYHSSSTGESLGSPIHSGELHPGVNPTIRERVSGRHVYVRFRNPVLDERWALEGKMMAKYTQGTKKRAVNP